MIFIDKNMFTQTENKSPNFGFRVKSLFIKSKEGNISEGTYRCVFFLNSFFEKLESLKNVRADRVNTDVNIFFQVFSWGGTVFGQINLSLFSR